MSRRCIGRSVHCRSQGSMAQELIRDGQLDRQAAAEALQQFLENDGARGADLS